MAFADTTSLYPKVDRMNYLSPAIPDGVGLRSIPVVDATTYNLSALGKLIASPDECDVEIVRWPAQGWRPVDEDSGDEGGVHEGEFHCQWKGDFLYGINEAVGGHYILGYSTRPEMASEDHDRPPERLLLWHANYHPDGGQLFFPLDAKPYLVPVAPPGDDVTPEDFVCLRVPGDLGFYLHPNVWHEGVFPIAGSQRFFDRQGAVHARVSVDFSKEFDCLLAVSLASIDTDD